MKVRDGDDLDNSIMSVCTPEMVSWNGFGTPALAFTNTTAAHLARVSLTGTELLKRVFCTWSKNNRFWLSFRRGLGRLAHTGHKCSLKTVKTYLTDLDERDHRLRPRGVSIST